MKIPPVGAKLFHADGRRDMMKLKTAFRNFANAQKHLYFRDLSTHVSLYQISNSICCMIQGAEEASR